MQQPPNFTQRLSKVKGPFWAMRVYEDFQYLGFQIGAPLSGGFSEKKSRASTNLTIRIP